MVLTQVIGSRQLPGLGTSGHPTRSPAITSREMMIWNSVFTRPDCKHTIIDVNRAYHKQFRGTTKPETGNHKPLPRC